jgi:type II secretory ATPase GspE/PulE/Tfp pilus assembly ATPase PilB-like protein
MPVDPFAPYVGTADRANADPAATAADQGAQATPGDVPVLASKDWPVADQPPALVAALQAQAQSPELGFVCVDAQRFPIDPQAWHCAPGSVLQRLNLLPLLHLDGELVVAVADLREQGKLDELTWVSERRVRPVLADAQQIRLRLQALVQGQESLRGLAMAPAPSGAADRWLADVEQETLADTSEPEEALDQEAEHGLVQLINRMIIDARARGASDIHVETQPGRQKLRIRFRLDGRLQPYRELPHTVRAALVARLKIMCGLDISERRKPQDGKIQFARFSPSHPLELRVVTIPTVQGLEDVVLRLLTAIEPLPLGGLDLHPLSLLRFKSVIERPHGLILCAGPTGSGKSTTLHAALAHLNTPQRKIWTAEDPVEITQPGLRQVQVNPRIDWTFEKALRSFLRADPDVIMVGEVRDRDTARVAVEAALTGHLVLSTIHTNSAAETVTRLLDMGLDPFNFGDSLLAVLGQRLVRRLCTQCRQTPGTTDVELQARAAAQQPSAGGGAWDGTPSLGGGGPAMRWWAPGCAHCQGSGLRGRIGLHELLIVSPEIRALIYARQAPSLIQACAIDQGMVSLRQDGIEKVQQGMTTLEEVRASINA